MQTYRHRLPSSGVGLSLQTTGQSTLELHNSGRCPASSLRPAGEFTFVNCFLQGLAQDSLPAGAGLCLPASLSPAAHLVMPQLAFWAALPNPLHLPLLSVSCLPPSWLEGKKMSVLHFDNHIQVTQRMLIIFPPTAPSFSFKHPNMPPPHFMSSLFSFLIMH